MKTKTAFILNDLYYAEILIQRYNECDLKGHLKPNNDICCHCYRHLDKILIDNKIKKLCYFPKIRADLEKETLRRNQIRNSEDLLKGIELLIKELNPELI